MIKAIKFALKLSAAARVGTSALMIQVIDQCRQTCISPLFLWPWKDLSTKMKDESVCWTQKSGKIQVTSVASVDESLEGRP